MRPKYNSTHNISKNYYTVNTEHSFPSVSTAQRRPGPSHSWEFEITHDDTAQSVWVLKTRDQPTAETCTWHHSQETNIHIPGRIRTRNPSKRSAADPRLSPLGHWNRQCSKHHTIKQTDGTRPRRPPKKHAQGKSILVIYYIIYIIYLRLYLPSDPFPSSFPTKILYVLHLSPTRTVLISRIIGYMVRSTNHEAPIMQFSPVPCYLLPLRPQYPPQHPTLLSNCHRH